MELVFENLCKSYGEKQALKDVSFTLTSGVYGILGPNGAGKSTMMNILAGNLRQTSGKILFDGRDIHELGVDFRSRLGYMPQQQSLYPDFTAERFLFYIGALRGLKKKEARRRVPWALRQVELSDYGRKRIGSMSGGMKQRLLIAQAILADPDVLILDEPTAGLDPHQRIAVRNLIGRLASSKIVMISTHVVSDVEYIANEILLLKAGTLLYKGTGRQLSQPLNGKVYEIEAPVEATENILSSYRVGNIIRDGDVVRIRVLSETEPPFKSRPQPPNLEDVYLYYFEEPEISLQK